LARFADFSSTELVRVCAGSKDEKAWEEFIRRFRPVVAAAALRTARRWSEPACPQLDDLIQDTYLKLCEDDCNLLRSFQSEHEDSFYGFLKVVAANVVHDHFKSALAAKRGAGRTEAIVEPLLVELKSPGIDGFNLVTQRLQLNQIDKILRQVTAGKGKDKDQERNRAIFWLRHRLGFTSREIAQIPSIGLTTEGVESVLVRLLAAIQSHMMSSSPHREVKGRSRRNRSKR
jgi:RNA polymerase sigma-70 factor (ECF subfamily)